MSPRVFLGWLVVTVATVVLAVVFGLSRETSSFDPLERVPVFDALRADPDAAARVEVRSRFGEFTLVRGADGWITPDRSGYPVEESAVRRLVAGLADMRYIERKTSNPERFGRLEVQDIDDELSDSAHVTVSNAGGSVLADAIVGRPSARFFDGQVSGTYIREPGTNNVWLVSGVTNVQTRLVPWLQRDIVQVPATEVAGVSVGEGEGSYALSREATDQEAFALSGAPEGRKLDPSKATSISRALANVGLEDVRPRSEFSLPDDASVAEVSTFSGLTIRMRLAEIDRKRWAVFEAAYTGDAADQSEAANAARALADEINARTGDWVYWVPSSVYTNLTRPLDDVLAPEDSS
jgi:hypothetical protein